MLRLSVTDRCFVVIVYFTFAGQVLVFGIPRLRVGLIVRNAILDCIYRFTVCSYRCIEVIILICSLINKAIHFTCRFSYLAYISRHRSILVVPAEIACHVGLA